MIKENITLRKEIINLKNTLKEYKKIIDNQKNTFIEKNNEKNNTENNKKIENSKKRTIEHDITSTNNNFLPSQQPESSNNLPLQNNDFPYLQAINNNTPQHTTTTNPWTRRQRNQMFRKNNPSKKQMESASRTFEEKIENNKFINVYLPCKHRMRPSDIRKKLAFVGVDNVQILDTYCPDWDTVLLLIHEKYKDELEKKLEKAGIHLKEYDYLHVSHLRDPRFATLVKEEKIEKLLQIRNNCSMRALSFIRNPVKGSVARSFFTDNIISAEQLKEVLNSRNVASAQNAFSNVENTDREMTEVEGSEKETEKNLEDGEIPLIVGTQQQATKSV